MTVEDDPRKNTEDGAAVVSSRLLMIPAFLVACMTVFGVLYAFSSTARKAVRPPDAGAVLPAKKKAGADSGAVVVPGAPPSPVHSDEQRFLPGEPVVDHQA